MTALRNLRCLVPGGAGYIGSHVVRELQDRGADVVVLDDFSTGHRWAVQNAQVIELDLADTDALTHVMKAGRFDAVLHFAAKIWVGQSVKEPGLYYRNNTANAGALFDLAAANGVEHVVFSSTAAVYGEPKSMPIAETAPLAPINPYGASKLMSERILQDVAAAHGQNTAILRYFNVAGAHDDGSLGEATPDNSHLLKVCCEAGFGLRPRLAINGTDYPTPDGTCVRDYIHVQDLAKAHVAALERLTAGPCNLVLNCGYGHGFSVREMIDRFHQVTGIDLDPSYGPRRPGDPAELVADNTAILRDLDWRPERDDLDLIVASAWAWEQTLQAQRQGPAKALAYA